MSISTINNNSNYNEIETLRHNWTKKEIFELFNMTFLDLMFQAQLIHRKYYDPNKIQLSQLCNIKTGGCSEDCKYCPQSSRYNTNIKASKLKEVNFVIEQAKKAKKAGVTRYCLGAAWRNLKDRDINQICAMIKGIRSLGMESCVTLGMLTPIQISRFKKSGLNYYNHNIDTSEEYYKKIITTRSYQDRLNTIENVRNAGINVCSGGIIGMGENKTDRVDMLKTLANMKEHPNSIPINKLVEIKGTPLYKNIEKISDFNFIRTIAVTRIMMPKSYVRLSAGRENMSDKMQVYCFMAGANSIFYGEKLLTTSNPTKNKDMKLFEELGILPERKIFYNKNKNKDFSLKIKNNKEFNPEIAFNSR